MTRSRTERPGSRTQPRPDPQIDQRISREARVVGLRDFRTPSLEAVERRRMQLWAITAVVLVGLAALAALLSFQDDSVFRQWLTPPVLRFTVIGLSLAFCAYAIEKEVHLRRLSRLLIDERVLTTALSNRLHEVSLLLEAGRAMNSVLELRSVLDIILGSALELLEGTSGSIMLVEGEQLRAVCVRGNDAARDAVTGLGESIAGTVALRREPLLISGRADPERFPGREPRRSDVESALSVPLVSRDELLGVLNVNAASDRRFTEYDLRALSLFAEQAAGAIANARLYEAERAHVAELLELDRMKSEFLALVSHELRTPLTSVLAAAQTARREDAVAIRPELLDIIERQTRRLGGMVEDLLTAARQEHGPHESPGEPTAATADLAEIVRLAAGEFAVAGKPVRVSAPQGCPVHGEADALRRVLDNLLENAHRYGAPPVEANLEVADERALLSVVDAGPGIPEDRREEVFRRFSRLHDGGEHPGLGLGLPIVRDLVRELGGDVWIDDAPRGTTVRVSLPIAVPSVARP
jgi:signal transduction histidine kinase